MVVCVPVGVIVLTVVYPKVVLVIMGITISAALLSFSIYKIRSFVVHMLDISKLSLTKEEMKNKHINTLLEYMAFLVPICIRKKREITPDSTPKDCSYYKLSEVKTVEIYKNMISIFGKEEVSMFLKKYINAINTEKLSKNINITDIEIIRKNIKTQGTKYVENSNAKTSIWRKHIKKLPVYFK